MSSSNVSDIIRERHVCAVMPTYNNVATVLHVIRQVLQLVPGGDCRR